MVTLLLLIAIVMIILLFRHIAGIETINTKLFKTDPAAMAATVQPAAPEAQPAEIPVGEETPAEAAPQAEAEIPAEEQTTTEAAPVVSGTLIDTGIIRTVCPDGWMSIQLNDVYGEKDENGNYPPDLTRIGLCKGGTTQSDAFSKLTIYILYANGKYDDNTLENAAVWHSETEDFTAVINGVEYQGFHAKEEDLFVEGNFYEYDYLFMPADDSHHIEFEIMTSSPDVAEKLSLDDVDVHAIISSFALD